MTVTATSNTRLPPLRASRLHSSCSSWAARSIEWYNLGNGFFAMGDNESATMAYRRVIELNPNHAVVWNNLGALEGGSGNTQAAVNDYARAASLGDQVARNNYQRLQNAMAAAERPQQPVGALRKLEISPQAERDWQAHREWQEHFGEPPKTGQD